MKKFTLKKSTQGVQKPGKGLFSLKKAPLGGTKKTPKTPAAFQDHTHREEEPTDIVITSVEDIKTEQKGPLVIQPILDNHSWENRHLASIGKNPDDNDPPVVTEGVSIAKEASNRRRPAKRDIDSYPDPPTEESYKRVPVDQFGMAMLRGMGWTPEYESQKTKSQMMYKHEDIEESR